MPIERFTLFYLWVAALIVLPTSWGAADTGAPGCTTRNVTKTFIQLWRSDAKWTDREWDARLQALKRLGFKEIIVQWNVYDNVSFFKSGPKHLETSSSMGPLIRAAARQNLRIQIGLQYDPDFWKRIGDDKKIEHYLKKRLDTITATLAPLLNVVKQSDPDGAVVNGWYISDEIDDVNWREDKQRKVLTQYLASLRMRLTQRKPNWPVSISGFATGAMNPADWAQMWKQLLDETNINTLLFQDGIGTGQMNIARLPAYLSALSTALDSPSPRLGVIVEIFDVNPSPAEFKTQSAGFKRIAGQIKIAEKHTKKNITVFSATDHLIGRHSQLKQELQRNWLNDRALCRRTAGKPFRWRENKNRF